MDAKYNYSEKKVVSHVIMYVNTYNASNLT